MAYITALTGPEWEYATSASFVQLKVQDVAASFRGSIRHNALCSDLQLSEVEAGASRLVRTAKAARGDHAGSFLFAIHRSGRGMVQQLDRTALLTPGQGTLYSTAVPYELTFPVSTNELVLKVPFSRITVGTSAAQSLCATPLDLSSPEAKVLVDYLHSMHSLAKEGASPAALLPLSGVAVELFNIMLAATLGNSPEAASEGALIATLRSYITAHFRDPDLSPGTLALRHHISLRQLYKVFSAEPAGPAGVIRQARLRGAHYDLASPLHRHRPIAAIAAMNGFSDSSTFNRSFYKEFGQTPTQWRHASSPTATC